ncbi:MAG: hypothetical protein U0414_06095 [Polyangiaceae bacterium]
MSLGFVHNPFNAADHAPGALPWFESTPGELAGLVDRALEARAPMQMVGAHGTGKSTLLVHLEAAARERGSNVVLFRGSRGAPLRRVLSLRGSSARPLVLVDEMEELGALTRIATLAAARLAGGAVVVSTHRDLGLDTLVTRAIDARTAARVVDHLLVASRRTDLRPLSMRVLDSTLARHRGNLRDVLFELYDVAERARSSVR